MRSIRKKRLHYTKFYGGGDSRSFLVVKDTYKGTKVKKIECVGHVQKGEGCWLRNFKKMWKDFQGSGNLLMLWLIDYKIITA